MSIRPAKQRTSFRWVFVSAAVLVAAAGCASGGMALPGSTANAGSRGGSLATAPAATPATESASSAEPDTGTTSGDVPDNAVFLSYRDRTLGYAIQYVEGWQVSPTADGVAIRDKDSSELVQVVALQTAVSAYVSATDLPALRQQAGFRLAKLDMANVSGNDLVHLVYDILSPPDAVTGKQVPLTVDRYYVPGPNGLAIVSLATPKGVDNVDAFRQMIESFQWA